LNGYPILGDFVHVRSPTDISAMIAWATRTHGEQRTLSTHVSRGFDHGRIIHALYRRGGVIVEDWELARERFLNEDIEWCIVRRVPGYASHEQRMIAECLREMIGWHYSALELPLHLVDGLIAKAFRRPLFGLDVVVFRRLQDLWKRGVICSATAAWPDIKLGDFHPRMRFSSPDDIWDYQMRSDETHAPIRWQAMDWSNGWWGPIERQIRRPSLLHA
jgi:hypothetical protein